MPSFIRMLLVATALLTSGVLQVAAAKGEDACCTHDEGGSSRDCPPGLACSCCPARGAIHVVAPEVAPAATPGLAVPVSVLEPTLVASAADIFHPPRA